MTAEHWTVRYGGGRIAEGSITLRGPMCPHWRVRPGGQALGWARAGAWGVVANVGKDGVAYLLDLASGTEVWSDATQGTASCALRYRDELLVSGSQRVRFLDPTTGCARREQEYLAGMGLNDSYLIGDILVGSLADRYHAVDVSDLTELWAVPELITNPLVGDERHVIRADTDVTCHDLRNGKVLWRRTGSELGGRAYQYGCIWRKRYYVVFGDALTCLDLKSGKTVWRWALPSFIYGWHPYGGRAYFLLDDGYVVADLETGKEVFRRALGARVPEPERKDRKKMRGLRAGSGGAWPWRGTSVVVSETHAFLTNGPLGRIVVLERETGELVQVLEFGGMPTIEPVIYDNHLLIADFNATVHCFRGAT